MLNYSPLFRGEGEKKKKKKKKKEETMRCDVWIRAGGVALREALLGRCLAPTEPLS